MTLGLLKRFQLWSWPGLARWWLPTLCIGCCFPHSPLKDIPVCPGTALYHALEPLGFSAPPVMVRSDSAQPCRDTPSLHEPFPSRTLQPWSSARKGPIPTPAHAQHQQSCTAPRTQHVPREEAKPWATWTRCETKAPESTAATSASAHSSESFL